LLPYLLLIVSKIKSIAPHYGYFILRMPTVLIREFCLVAVLYCIKPNHLDGYVSGAEVSADILKFLMLILLIGGYKYIY
jgi:hypothetical protein